MHKGKVFLFYLHFKFFNSSPWNKLFFAKKSKENSKSKQLIVFIRISIAGHEFFFLNFSIVSHVYLQIYLILNKNRRNIPTQTTAYCFLFWEQSKLMADSILIIIGRSRSRWRVEKVPFPLLSTLNISAMRRLSYIICSLSPLRCNKFDISIVG